MQVLNVLPFKEAVLFAVGVASSVTIVLGLIFFRRRSGAAGRAREGAGSGDKLEISEGADRLREAKLIEELNTVAVALASTLDRLDTAVERCLELMERLPADESEKGGVRVIHSPAPRPEVMKSRIERLKSSGVMEEEIAEKLNLSREQLQLYMHSGTKSPEKVVLQ